MQPPSQSPEQLEAEHARSVADEKRSAWDLAGSDAIGRKFQADQRRALADQAQAACRTFNGHEANPDYQEGVSQYNQAVINYNHGKERWDEAWVFYMSGTEAYTEAQKAYDARQWFFATQFWTLAAANFETSADKSGAASSYFLLARLRFEGAEAKFHAALAKLQMNMPMP